MPNHQCQGEGCSRPGVMRSLVDEVEKCVWRIFLCDHCDGYLLDHEKFALARTKGIRVER
jgi:hypothetical protein